jgi:hypothetical protein
MNARLFKNVEGVRMDGIQNLLLSWRRSGDVGLVRREMTGRIGDAESGAVRRLTGTRWRMSSGEEGVGRKLGREALWEERRN